jgi:hypothetical protein
LPHPVAYFTTSNVYTRYIGALFCELIIRHSQISSSWQSFSSVLWPFALLPPQRLLVSISLYSLVVSPAYAISFYFLYSATMRQYGEEGSYGDNGFGSFDDSYGLMRQYGEEGSYGDDGYGSFDDSYGSMRQYGEEGSYGDDGYGSFDDSYGSMRQYGEVGSYGDDGYGSFDDSYGSMRCIYGFALQC